MSKAEKFIQDYTRNCSNELSWGDVDELDKEYAPWLTPDQARRAVEIAREEVIEKICMWLEDNISENCYGDYLEFTATSIFNIDFFNQEALIKDLKQVMKDE